MSENLKQSIIGNCPCSTTPSIQRELKAFSLDKIVGGSSDERRGVYTRVREARRPALLLAKRRAVTIILSISFLLVGSLSTYAQAQSKAKKHKQSINFEDELIQGEVKGTDLLYLLSRKQFNYKKLIKLRKDFLPEMRRSAESVERGGM